MILIQFPDRETENKGLSVLMNGFSGKVLRGGLHIVPEPALEALNAQNIPYTVKGPASYEHEVAALRGDAAATIQCRPRSAAGMEFSGGSGNRRLAVHPARRF
jgi:hypothetical protein